jgi:hypothetical protein
VELDVGVLVFVKGGDESREGSETGVAEGVDEGDVAERTMNPHDSIFVDLTSGFDEGVERVGTVKEF